MTAEDLRAEAYPGGPMWVEIESVADLLRKGQTVELGTRGSSMWPLIHAGERIWLAPALELHVGDVAAVQTANGFVTHRIVANDGDSVELCGDHADHGERVRREQV